tara:strand:+ start:1329 stop:1841 length:513 start_codon:yes stop_codon:yes gene_type:complete
MQDNFSIRNWKNKKVYKEEYNAGLKEDDKFAGQDPKAGSTIQGTGYNWPMSDATRARKEDDREDDELTPEELANKYAGSPMREEDDIELEIPGDEGSAPVGDKKLQAKLSRQDVKIKAYKDITVKMKDTLEKYKSAEGDAKDVAKEELKILTPEFQAAKKEYEKLKGVKI